VVGIGPVEAGGASPENSCSKSREQEQVALNLFCVCLIFDHSPHSSFPKVLLVLIYDYFFLPGFFLGVCRGLIIEIL